MSRLRKTSAALAAASLGLAGCVSNSGVPEAAPMNPAAMYAVVAAADACPSLGEVRPASLPPEAWVQPPLDPRHAEIGARLAPPARGSTIVLSFYGWVGHHGAYEQAVSAARGQEGAWRVESLTRSGDLLVPPSSVSSSSHRAPAQTRVVSDADGRRLDDLIASRCLAAEPRRVSFRDPPACFDHRHFLQADIHNGGVVMRFQQSCGRGGTVGEIAELLLNAAS